MKAAEKTRTTAKTGKPAAKRAAGGRTEQAAPARKRQRLQPEARREQVLAVAAGVFAEKGYRSALITDIVEGAGIGRGTFYLYFDSKKDVFLELIEGYFEGFAALLKQNHIRLETAVRDGGDAIATWRENMVRIFAYHRDNPEVTSVVYRDGLGMDEDFAERVDELSSLARMHFHEQFRLLGKYGLIRPVDLDVVASIVMGSAVYVIMEHLVKDSRRSVEQLADEMMQYHIRALMPDAIPSLDELRAAAKASGVAAETGAKRKGK